MVQAPRLSNTNVNELRPSENQGRKIVTTFYRFNSTVTPLLRELSTIESIQSLLTKSSFRFVYLLKALLAAFLSSVSCDLKTVVALKCSLRLS